MTARQVFGDIVNRLATSGVPRQKAVLQAQVENPLIYKAMMQEATIESTNRAEAAERKPTKKSPVGAVAEFKSKVDALVNSGTSRQKAVMRVAEENRDLYQRMMAESNGMAMVGN